MEREGESTGVRHEGGSPTGQAPDLQLDDIRFSVSPSTQPDDKTSGEAEEFRHEQARLERYRAETEGLSQDIAERKKYANRLYWLISVWLVGLFAVLAAQGLDSIAFRLSDKVLMTLIGGTTANVIGIFIVVANYLFPKRPG